MYRRNVLILLTLLLFAAASCKKENIRLSVFHAGSLSVPLKEMAAEFQQVHPGIHVQLEGAGSLTCVRKITELHKPCDVLALADYALIDELMIPEHADFNIRFAGNELAIGYAKDSKWDTLLNAGNWPHVLLRENVHYGRSDPDRDPSGYRTEIMMGMAEKTMGIPGLKQRMLAKDRKFIRPKGTELLPLLETGAIGFIFHYRSVLVQHNLGTLRLPDSLNMRDPSLDNWYVSECVEVAGKSPGERIQKCGEAMVYGITLPKNGKHPEAANKFLKFVLTRGQQILQKHGQPVLEPEISSRSLHAPNWFSTLKQ
ncbi:MAG: extracellular solute-binding protein [Bacteroidales bacterium]